MDKEQKLKNFLQEKKFVILEKWFQAVLKTYPEETQAFLQKKENTFTNPIGATIYESLAGLLAEIIQDKNSSKILNFLDEIIRLRAIQNLSPSQAIFFVPALKGIIKKELKEQLALVSFQEELDQLANLLDHLTLQAFDIYMGCREKIFRLKTKELQKFSGDLIKYNFKP